MAQQWSIPGVTFDRALGGDCATIFALAWSPDGTRIAASAFDSTVRIWDTASGREAMVLRLDGGSAFTVAWSPDGSRLATGDTEKRLQIWEVSSGRCLQVLRAQDGILFSVDWSPDGLSLASGSYQGTVFCWNALSGAVEQSTSLGREPVHKVAWSPDGTTVAAATRQVVLWEPGKNKPVVLQQQNPAEDVDLCWSPSGKLLCSASREGICLWDPQQRAPIWSGNSPTHWFNRAVAFAPGERFVATMSLHHELRFWSIPNLACIAVLRLQGANENRLNFHPTRPLLALTDCEESDEIQLWNIDFDKLSTAALASGGTLSDELRRPHSPAPATPQEETPAIVVTPEAKEFDVFLCHNGIDKPAVRKIAEMLRANHLEPWLDEWELRPGLPWQPVLESTIQRIKSAAVFVGKAGLGPWQQQELQAFLDQFVRRSCPIIPVLLPDAPAKPEVPAFLNQMTWVDFRSVEPDPLVRLIWGITGRRENGHSR